MKLPLLCLLLTAGVAHAATNATYTASADPNADPDANGNTVNVWNLSHGGDAAGASNNYSGSYYATGVGMLGTAWAIYSNHNYTTTLPASSEEDQTSTLAGGALTLGQTVSIDFLASAVDSGQQYGIRLFTGTTFVLALSFVGGDGGYRYYDGTSGGTIPFGYQGNGFHFAYTQKTATTYTVVATPIGGGAAIGTFSGTVSGSPDTLQVYNQSAGQDQNVLTNNLAIVPEPGSCVFLTTGALLLAGLAMRSRKAA